MNKNFKFKILDKNRNIFLYNHTFRTIGMLALYNDNEDELY